MPFDLSLHNLLPFKDKLTILKERDIFIINMKYHDSNSSYHKISLDPYIV